MTLFVGCVVFVLFDSHLASSSILQSTNWDRIEIDGCKECKGSALPILRPKLINLSDIKIVYYTLFLKAAMCQKGVCQK